MDCLLAGHYRAVWGFAVRQKSGRSGAKWVNEVLVGIFCTDSDKVIVVLIVWPHCHCDAGAVSIILHANYARIAQILI